MYVRNRHPSLTVPRFGRIRGHIGQTGSDGMSGENFNSLNKQNYLVGPEGFEPPTKGL
jgi:hypothetical protein